MLRTYLLINNKKAIFSKTVVERPLLDNPVDKKRVKEWINAQPLELRELFRFFAGQITYINQNEFELKLEEAIAEFNVANKGKPYFIATGHGKSMEWVYRLAIEKGLLIPTQVIEMIQGNSSERMLKLFLNITHPGR